MTVLEKVEFFRGCAGNWYAFVSNNPLRYVDPTGLLTENADGSVTFDEEEDTLEDGAEAAGYESVQDAAEQGAVVDSEGQLVADFGQWYDEDGNLTDYAKENNKSLQGLTISGADQDVVLVMRGHSATNPGSPSHEKETDLIEQLTPDLVENLQSAGFFVALDPQQNYPSGDYGIEARKNDLKNNEGRIDIALSLHFNYSSNSNRSGFEIYHPSPAGDNPKSYRLGQSIRDALDAGGMGFETSLLGEEHTRVRDLGVLGASNDSEWQHNVPMVLLEPGYYSNTNDTQMFNNSDARFLFARDVTTGVYNYFNQ